LSFLAAKEGRRGHNTRSKNDGTPQEANGRLQPNGKPRRQITSPKKLQKGSTAKKMKAFHKHLQQIQNCVKDINSNPNCVKINANRDHKVSNIEVKKAILSLEKTVDGGGKTGMKRRLKNRY
jgi:hypothetical protein